MRIKSVVVALAGAASLTLASSASAIPVDLELSLVIDVSGSVSAAEYSLQMDGYASAFRDGAIQSNILGGPNGAIAVNVVFFAANFFTTSLDAFALLANAAAINTFADTLDTFARPGSGGTAINAGMNRSIALLLADNGFESTNLVMDVSGDGTSSTTATAAARDAAAAAGITVNGLAIGSSAITDFYQDFVITPDGFVITASTFDDFGLAVRDKLAVETGGTIPEPASLALLGIGLAGLGAMRRRKG